MEHESLLFIYVSLSVIISHVCLENIYYSCIGLLRCNLKLFFRVLEIQKFERFNYLGEWIDNLSAKKALMSRINKVILAYKLTMKATKEDVLVK